MKKIEDIIKDSTLYAVFVSEYPLHGGLVVNKLIEAIEEYAIKARIEELEKANRLHCQEGDEKILIDTLKAESRLRIAELKKGLK